MPSAVGVKRALAVSAPSSVTGGPSVWVHAKLSGAGTPSGLVDALPSSTTASPILPVWSGPASATGGWLGTASPVRTSANGCGPTGMLNARTVTV